MTQRKAKNLGAALLTLGWLITFTIIVADFLSDSSYSLTGSILIGICFAVIFTLSVIGALWAMAEFWVKIDNWYEKLPND